MFCCLELCLCAERFSEARRLRGQLRHGEHHARHAADPDRDARLGTVSRLWESGRDTDTQPMRQVVNHIPWLDRPEDRYSGRLEWYDSALFRGTYQVSQNNKFNFTYDEQRACNCGTTTAGRAMEAQPGYRFDPNRLMQYTWTSTVTSRLLIEAGGADRFNGEHPSLLAGWTCALG